MPTIETKHLGWMEYTPDALLTFPSGLPGFDRFRAFIFLRKPAAEPLVFMQSLDDRALCFILLPILVVDANYKLEMTRDELEELGLPLDRQPLIGQDIFCGALLCAGTGAPPTANLMSPIVINLSNRVGIQAIQSASGYSTAHPLVLESATC
jgi:flagellar assembly factor FliW